MIAEVIGSNARLIWNFVETNGKVELSELLEKIKLNDADFNMALGWLIREGKITFLYFNKKAVVVPAF